MGKFLLFLVSLSALVSGVSCANQKDFAAAPPVSTKSVSEFIKQADELYLRRADDLNKVRKAAELLRQARLGDGANFEAAWKSAQANYFLGNNTKNEKERDQAFKDGISAGKSAVTLQPARAEGYFWTGVNQGGQARANVLDAAANVGDIRRNMEKVIELEPGYQGATAFVVLAKIELETRGMLGGDAAKAARYMEEALKYDKNNSMIYVTLAEAHFHTGKKAEARQMLAAMRRLPKDEKYAAEQREVETEAEKLERKL